MYPILHQLVLILCILVAGICILRCNPVIATNDRVGLRASATTAVQPLPDELSDESVALLRNLEAENVYTNNTVTDNIALEIANQANESLPLTDSQPQELSSSTNPMAMRPRKYFKVPLVFDSSAVQALGGFDAAKRRAVKIVKRMKQIIQDLPPLILQVPEVHFWTPGQELLAMKTLDFNDEGFQLNSFTAWRVRNITVPHAVGHMFTAKPFRNYIDTKMIFAKKSACKTEIASTLSTISGIADDNLIAKYAVHALAHALGLDHLTVFSSYGVTMNDALACMKENGEVMQSTARMDQNPAQAVWTECSRTWLRMYFEGFPFMCSGDACLVSPIYNGRPDYPACMETPAPRDAFPVCGDGVVQSESGEECDCGDPKTCQDKCCDPNTCKLQPQAKCSAQDACCNAKTCLPFTFSETRVCRAASSTCDVEEICDGTSPKCPNDVTLPVAASCAGPNGKSGLCNALGTCQDLSQQCQVLFNNPLAKPCPAARITKPCLVSCILPGAKKCVTTKKVVADGANCGKSKICQKGACVAARKAVKKPVKKAAKKVVKKNG